MKICNKCGRELPISEFEKNRKLCKECRKQQCRQYYYNNVERQKQHYQKNREKKLEYQKQRYQEHKEEISEYNKQHYQSNRDIALKRQKQYYQDNKEEIIERQKQYYKDNKEEIAEYHKQYYSTQNGRSIMLDNAYKQEDKKYGRENNIAAQYIVDNIFTNKCIYCGESDWEKLGCDRIDNSIGHIESNVVCCCTKCNKERGTKSFEEFYLMKRGLTSPS